VHSPFGHVLVAIRDNPARARAIGYPVERYKLLAFVLSAAMSGLAGGDRCGPAAQRFARVFSLEGEIHGEATVEHKVGEELRCVAEARGVDVESVEGPER